MEACTHVLMDMTCRLTGLDSVSPVLDLSHGHGTLILFGICKNTTSILRLYIWRYADSWTQPFLSSIRLDIVMSC